MPRAEILSTQAMHTLRQLHAELGGKLIDNKSEARRLIAAMKQVEGVMKLLQPGYDVRPIAVRRRKPNPWFRRGTVFRATLDVLRTATEPMTARQITEAMVKAKGVADPDQREIRRLSASIQTCLQSNDGKTVHRIGDGIPGRWKIAPEPSRKCEFD
jgi:hypothetical protein